MARVPNSPRRRMPSRRGFQRPGDDHAKHETRELFFRAVHEVSPRVTGELIDNALPLYRPLFDAAVTRLPEERRFLWRTALIVPSWPSMKYASDAGPPVLRQLRDYLLEWQSWWRLREDESCGEEWCLVAAVETLAELSDEGDNPKPKPLHYLGQRMIDIPFRDDELRFDFSFSHPGWSPTLEGWTATRERAGEDWGAPFDRIWDDLLRAARAALVDYKTRIDALAREEGLEVPTALRDRTHDHLTWLARCTTGREHFSEVARDDEVSTTAVGKAVHLQARMIGLALPDHLKRPGLEGNVGGHAR